MNCLSTTSDFIHYLRICCPKLVAIDPSLHESVEKALAQLPSLSAASVMFLLGSDPRLPNVCRLS
jgi:hypothetical protein